MASSITPIYRQTPESSLSKNNITHVNVGKYILTHKNQINSLKTLLGSCVALIGFKEGHGFMTHLIYYKDADKMIGQLRNDIQMKTGYILEDFHLTITGGNNVIQEMNLDPGKLNIEAVLGNLQRKPDAQIHLGLQKGNVVQLSLVTGEIESRGIMDVNDFTFRS